MCEPTAEGICECKGQYGIACLCNICAECGKKLD